MRLTKTLLISAVLLMSATGMQAAGFNQNGNYLTVQLKQHQNFGPSQIRLQVVSDKIIRVQATAEQSFRNKQSLIIVPQNSKANYKVEEQGDNLIITTAAMRAVMNEATGQITFYDLKDNVLLNEVAQGGKTFKPFTVPDREIGVDIAKVPEAQKHGWSWRALFNSPDNEAFYGLGQHQSEELNMKGKNEDLFQYNTKVSVPFVISNKNYGILWDSYSYCRWGNPEDYLQLNRAFKLYDKDGKEGQLTGTYVDKNGQKIVRGEDSIYFEYAMPEASEICNKTDKGGIQNLPKGFDMNTLVIEPFADPFRAYPVGGDYGDFKELFTKRGAECYVLNTDAFCGKNIPKELTLEIIEKLVDDTDQWQAFGDFAGVSYMPLADYPVDLDFAEYKHNLRARMQDRLDWLNMYNGEHPKTPLPEEAKECLEKIVSELK